MFSKRLTKFQQQWWIANSATFALTVACVMYLGKAFEGELALPVAVYIGVVLLVALLLRIYVGDKDEQHLTKPFSKRD